MAMAMVTIAGSPSGIAATARLIAQDCVGEPVAPQQREGEDDGCHRANP
jgi:hypothetical protein